MSSTTRSPRSRRAGRGSKLGRPSKGYKSVILRLLPEQHATLTDAALRARLARKANASEGASLIVRHLVQEWIKDGKRWPET